MLLRHGADPNIRIEGVSALDLAKSRGTAELIRRLTNADASPEDILSPPSNEHSVQYYNHILFGDVLRHLTREERLRLYFGLQRSENDDYERSKEDVKTLLTGYAKGPLFT